MAKAKTTSKSDALIKELRDYGLKFPGAHLKSPWPGHKDLAVNDKTFVYLSVDANPFGISCKLPHSSAMALALPFTEPAGYGLGKSGWVSASIPADEAIPVDLFKAWIDESYRAQAPKKLVAQLGASTEGATASAKGPVKKPAKKTAATKAAPSKKQVAKKKATKKR